MEINGTPLFMYGQETALAIDAAQSTGRETQKKKVDELVLYILEGDPFRTIFRNSDRILANELAKQDRLIRWIRASLRAREGFAADVTVQKIRERMRLHDNGD